MADSTRIFFVGGGIRSGLDGDDGDSGRFPIRQGKSRSAGSKSLSDESESELMLCRAGEEHSVEDSEGVASDDAVSGINWTSASDSEEQPGPGPGMPVEKGVEIAVSGAAWTTA